MDTWVPPDDGALAPVGRDPLELRLAAIEARIDALEASMRAEMKGAGDDLRRAVSELGRLMLRDLDRLTRVLADHRDEIVDRLASAQLPSSGAEPPLPDTPDPANAAPPPDEAGAPGGRDEAGRWRVVPGRRARRSQKRSARGDTRGG